MEEYHDFAWQIIRRDIMAHINNMWAWEYGITWGQKGFLTIRNDLTQFIRSWLSRMKRLALEMLEIAIDLEMASGAERRTFWQQ